jgi:DNA-binding transcriptional ArsR family regulator
MSLPRRRLTKLEALTEAAECLRTIAHPHRLRMLQMLNQGDFTVGELAEACEIPSPMASEHLRLMQRCGLLDSRREGRRIYYHIAETHIVELLKCVEQQYGSGK